MSWLRVLSGDKRPRAQAPASQLLLILVAASAVAATAYASPAQDYMLYCMGCHGAQAEGVPGKVPPLAHALGRYMRTPAGRNYVLRVPGAANSVLSDEQLAAVLNWLAQSFDADELSSAVPLFSAAEVTRLRHSPLASVLAARSAVVRDLATTGTAPPASY
ncbi:MAG: cytochrome c, class [Gammaproteobacteria bacterium]|nr:cytochrome c, class [Gammaproteobacteria bacterium]